jgi:AraC-like DNA-binding protein/tetratricopeptide (TPR) repeat protein
MATALMPRDVQQALTLLNADPAGEHTVGKLALACGVAARTLQQHFRQFLGQSPIEALRGIRLDLVRRELLMGRDDTEITELATRHGFGHLGRFSGWYRERYGESPSETRGRQRSAIVCSRMATVALPFTLDRPVVTVQPFQFTGTPVRQITDLAGECAVALSRLRGVIVGTPRDARYLVRGNINANEMGRMWVTVRLLDAASGRFLWADTWEGEREGSFVFEDRVAHRITAKLQAAILDVEIERASRKEPEELTAWELTMRALSRAMVIEPPSQTEALDLASRAVELTPLDPLPSALAAWSHSMWATFTPRIAEARAAARVRADHAAQLRAGDATAEALLAGTYSMLHDLDAAELHVDRALALDGGCAWAWQRSGVIKIYRGRPVEAIECFQIAGGLDLADSLRSSNSFGFAAACFAASRYADSARWWRRGLVESPVALWANRFLAPACALSSRKDEALTSLHALRRGFPEWDYDRAKSMLPHTDAFNDQVANGLESIGVRVRS